jgi:hypothetical protein
VSYGDGDALIGQSVVKKFSRKKFTGRIVAYDPHTRWYKVLSSPLHVANVIISPLKIEMLCGVLVAKALLMTQTSTCDTVLDQLFSVVKMITLL